MLIHRRATSRNLWIHSEDMSGAYLSHGKFQLQKFLTKCCKTKRKVSALAYLDKRKEPYGPQRTLDDYMQQARSAGKRVQLT